MSITYLEAGVDIQAGDALIERIKPLAQATRIPEVIGGLGGFAGLCRVPGDIDDPVLVSGTDGVGTKLKVVFAADMHDTVGFDLVGMCVNDVLTTGARPLFFLDYFATGRLNVDLAERVIRSIASACKEAGCALLGGETAEMPGMYPDGEYDLAGFAVGVVARSRLIDGTRVQAGDALIGLPSSGLHSNGFSLARKVLLEKARLPLKEPMASLGGLTLAEALLVPTRIYARHVQALLATVDVHAMSHITGGGIPGNLPRVLPEGLDAVIQCEWPRAPIFDLLAELGPVGSSEMHRTFNCGIGFIFVVAQSDCDRAIASLRALGDEPVLLGEVVDEGRDVAFEDRVIWRGARP
ncbi:MAG: phosphoribosylformylglycinamidine cyclo-ligase [Myxococcales bacterium]|jgi:phosphoribosylformylglycinamidine cyclo-ligase